MADNSGQPPRRWWQKPAGVVAIGFLALVIGGGIGGVASRSDLDSTKRHLTDAEGQLASERHRSATLQSQLSAARERAQKLGAKGEVPDLVGRTVDDAMPLVADFKWQIKTRSAVSSKDPGTILAQTPKQGTQLAAGRSITVTIAREAPPKPAQWITLKSLSGSGGQSKSDEFEVPEGKVRLVYDMPGDGNNAITLYRTPKEYVDLLVNEVGPTHGSTRLYEPGKYYLDVTGSSYTVDIQQFK